MDINPNSAALFYRKIRQVIAYHLELQADEIFDGSVELDESVLADSEKANAVAEQLVR
ncbi:transposase [Kingella kingae PYKK081]|uniref:Transposase n=1 Tax=Kingella kingae ATCC 23330 TaxID=887327 RepID=F5S9L8_KINKI|nr:transposase [Kingella kingae ATCC 23330]EIC12713.1 transposase [Kingella kingae PYKK081]